MRIDIAELSGRDLLAGATLGRQVCHDMLSKVVSEPRCAELIYLDFANVKLATASFLRECVLEFKRVLRKNKSRFYPVVANMTDDLREELQEVAYARQDAIILCWWHRPNNDFQWALIGELDPKQILTFDLVHDAGETDAKTLMLSYGEQEGTTRTTAWNNRLSSLEKLGLLISEETGRAKKYRPIFERGA